MALEWGVSKIRAEDARVTGPIYRGVHELSGSIIRGGSFKPLV